jgi:hypothetical protein
LLQFDCNYSFDAKECEPVMRNTRANGDGTGQAFRLADEPAVQQRCDRFGIVASALCMVHCLATPLLLSVLPSLTPSWLESPLVHQVMGVGVLGVAVSAFVPGYLRHRRAWVPLLAAAGLGLVLFVAYGAAAPCCLACSQCRAEVSWSDRLYESRSTIESLAGCSLLVAAHLSNHRCCYRCAATDGG